MRNSAFEMTERIIVQSDDFLDGQIHTFDLDSVEIERSISGLTMITDGHCLEIFFCNWKVTGIYSHQKAKKPKKIIITAQKRTPGDVVALVEVDLLRRFESISENVTETRSRFIASSEVIAEGEKTMTFGGLQVRYTQQAIRVTDRYLQAEFFGSWEIRGVFDKTKDDLRRIEIDVYRDEKIFAYLSLKI